MSWWWLLFAGLLEIVWAVGLKYTHGFTRPMPSLLTIAAMGLGFFALSMALRELPLGTAYAIWVGIGVAGTAIAGIVLFQEAISPVKLGSLALILLGLIGLKLSSAG